MDGLPDVVVLKVFSFLSVADLGQVSRVCYQWQRIAYDHSLWKAVNLRRFAGSINEEILTALIRTRFSPQLVTLNLGGCRISHEVLMELTRKCKHLRYLIFGRGSKLRSPLLKRSVVYEFPPELELLELRPVKGDFTFMRRISRHFCSVKYLGIGVMSSKGAVPHIFTKMQQLVILDCTNCDTITDEVLAKVGQSCPLLESVCLNGCKLVYGTTFSEFLSCCKRLKTLLLRYTPVRDECFQCYSWKNIRLEEIDISACAQLTHVGLISLVSRMHSLRYLNLSYCGVGRAVTDEVLLEMATQRSCMNLEMLDVRWSLTLTPDALFTLAQAAPFLKCLGVYQSSNISPAAMAEVLVALPRLEVLEYGAFGKAALSDTMLIPNLIRHCKLLRSLSLINFASLDSGSDSIVLNALSEGCQVLNRINLCEPDPSLLALVHRAPESTKSKITQRWQCVLPPPVHTLDTVIAGLRYSHPPE
ncbi:F-box/LRR-repeat protein 2-like [Nematostella vectensis]|uniref:F-box/LRR-repeat protein 2-like n=1 Tax=Nematostella vectensis TaxID=45351 RepID=UPI0013905435|nr:F-box/LRR-repeat protein 2-like [Nematostella vectensis]